MDQNDLIKDQLGIFTLKTHPNGFYYLENSQLEKMTIFNYDAFVSKIINGSQYNDYWKIKLSYTSKINVVKNLILSIPH